MAFPLSPVNGQTTTLNGINYIYNSTSGAWTRIATASSTTSATAPTNPKVGDTWYDTATDDIYRYTSDGANSYWLDITGPTVANTTGLTVQNTSVYANYFSGSSSYLTAPTGTAFQFAGDFTIEGWFNSFSATGQSSYSGLFDTRATNVSSTTGIVVNLTPTGYLNLYINGNNYTSSVLLGANKWVHVALVRSSSTITLYQNGVSVASVSYATSLTSGYFWIGVLAGPAANGYWQGYISNLRVVNGTALYTAAFTIPSAPLTAVNNTVLLTCQTIPPADASTNNFTVTNTSVTLGLYSAQQTTSALTATSPIILPDSTQFSTANSFGMHNRLINGAMSIDQRNAGASQTITAGAALTYTVDRWYGYSTGANITGQRVAGAGALQYVYQFTGAASVTAIGFAQRIEAANSYDLNGSTVTLSAFLSNSLLSTVTWTAYYANTADTFGTLASPTRTQIATGSWTVSSTLTRYTTNIAIPAGATTGIEIVFSVGAQTSGTWQIGAVQFEPGTVATPFERRPIGTELLLCYRYYYIARSTSDYTCFVNTRAYSTTNATGPFILPVGMRALPTLTVPTPYATYWGSYSITNIVIGQYTGDFRQLNLNATGSYVLNGAANIENGTGSGANAYMAFSAEL
jgi:hypothetical protein